MTHKRSLPPLPQGGWRPDANAQADASTTATTPAPDRDATEATSAVPASGTRTVVIAVPSKEVAEILQNHIRVWILPDCTDLTVRAIVSPPGTPDEKIASILAELGGDPNDLAKAFPNILLGWRKEDPE